MKIKDNCKIWLPKDASPGDLVLGVTLIPGARAHIMLNIRKTNGRRDSVLLVVPARILEKAFKMIDSTEGLTIKEVGELELPES